MFLELGWGRGLIVVGDIYLYGFYSGFQGCVVFTAKPPREVVFGVWLVEFLGGVFVLFVVGYVNNICG